MPLRKLTKGELRNLVLPCKQLDYALDALDREPYVFPNVPLREGVVERVRECAHAWTKGQVPDDELDKAIVGFCYLVRNYPEHPAFDSLRDNLSDAEISTALRKIGDTYACKISPCISDGAKLYVNITSWNNLSYDPLYITTLGKLEPRLKEVGIKVLEDALRAICIIPADKKQVPQYQHWAISQLISKLYNYAHGFDCIRE